jgi:hypothetical protein
MTECQPAQVAVAVDEEIDQPGMGYGAVLWLAAIPDEDIGRNALQRGIRRERLRP